MRSNLTDEIGFENISQLRGETWFLGIGINEYSDSGFTTLNNPSNDVTDVFSILTERYENIDSTCSYLLVNSNATYEKILDTFDELRKKVGNTDRLIIYFAGHGHFDINDERGFWIPNDAKVNTRGLFIHNSVILEYIEDIKAFHTLLISDSCFSGSFFDAKRSNTLNYLESKPSRWALTSGRKDQVVSDGVNAENSPFAKALIDMLKNNTKDKLTISEIGLEIQKMVGDKERNQIPQYAELDVKGSKHGAFIFTLKSDEEGDWALAQESNTVSAYTQFIKSYPNSKYYLEAVSAHEKSLKNEKEELKKANTPEKISHFLDRYPDTNLKAKAFDKLHKSITKSNVRQHKKVKFSEHEMILVDGGLLLWNAQSRFFDSKYHENVVEGFYLSKFLVTITDYDLYCIANNLDMPDYNDLANPNCPVINVSKVDALKYCTWLSKITMRKYRLPSELEWEYAALGGKYNIQNAFSGSNDINEVAWYRGNSNIEVHPVGELSPNVLGLYDMSGNVWEWCGNVYNAEDGSKSTGISNLRGGSYMSEQQDCEIWKKIEDSIFNRTTDIGFRIALTI